jgi:glucose dehydrogenase
MHFGDVRLCRAARRYYGGEATGTKYSPLAQIDESNVAKLRIAWRWKADNFGQRMETNWEATSPSKAQHREPLVRALDKKTGKTLHEMELPGNETGLPMTYMTSGKQYIVVAVAKKGEAAELVALALPR